LFSRRLEVQRTEAYASPLRSLRPRWTAFLTSLHPILNLSVTVGCHTFTTGQQSFVYNLLLNRNRLHGDWYAFGRGKMDFGGE
jgi:hypothetical protein